MQVRWQGELSILWLSMIKYLHSELKASLIGVGVMTFVYLVAMFIIRVSWPDAIQHIGIFFFYGLFFVSNINGASAKLVFSHPEIILPCPLKTRETVFYSLLWGVSWSAVVIFVIEVGAMIAFKLPLALDFLIVIAGLLLAVLDALLSQTVLLFMPGKLFRSQNQTSVVTTVFDCFAAIPPIATFFIVRAEVGLVGFSNACAFIVSLVEIILIFWWNVSLFRRFEMS